MSTANCSNTNYEIEIKLFFFFCEIFEMDKRIKQIFTLGAFRERKRGRKTEIESINWAFEFDCFNFSWPLTSYHLFQCFSIVKIRQEIEDIDHIGIRIKPNIRRGPNKYLITHYMIIKSENLLFFFI